MYVLHNSTELRIVFRIRQSPSHIEGKREASSLSQSLFLDFPISVRHSNLLLIHCNSTISMQGPFHERTWSLHGNECPHIIGRFNWSHQKDPRYNTKVIHMTLLSIISAWFNCCLFHRHQVILPFDHPAKVFIIYSIIVNGIVQLQPRGIYGVYFIMNFVMIINPISLIFTTTNDSTTQRPIVANASSSDSQTDIDGYSFSLQWLGCWMSHHTKFIRTIILLL